MSSPDLPLSTPALLFPAISLLMLAYTNRFLGLAGVVRGLHATWSGSRDPRLARQIGSLRLRLRLIRHMQVLGVLSLTVCTASMALLFFGHPAGGQLAFGLSLLLMIASLAVSLVEIGLSGQALELQLSDIEDGRPQ